MESNELRDEFLAGIFKIKFRIWKNHTFVGQKMKG